MAVTGILKEGRGAGGSCGEDTDRHDALHEYALHSVVLPQTSSAPAEYSLDGVSLNVIVAVLCCDQFEAKEWMVNVVCASSWRLTRRALWKEVTSYVFGIRLTRYVVHRVLLESKVGSRDSGGASLLVPVRRFFAGL
jgi:hypothetical protein